MALKKFQIILDGQLQPDTMAVVQRDQMNPRLP